MKIQPINYSVSSKGLYFTTSKPLRPLTELGARKTTNNIIKISEQGIKYVEDTGIKPEVKEKFAKINWINKLAENKDVFVFFKTIRKRAKDSPYKYETLVDIRYLGQDGLKTEGRVVIGASNLSAESATKNIFRQLRKRNYAKYSV